MEKNKIVEELGKQAAAVGAARERYDGAGADVKIASAELLDAVVDAVKPALRAMGNRVTVAWDEDGQVPTVATFRALHLWGNSNPCDASAPACNNPDCTYHGDCQVRRQAEAAGDRGLYLTEHGDLILAKYSTEPNGSWQAEYELQTSRQVVDMVGDGLNKILDIIGVSLSAQARGAAGRKTAIFATKADRIRAAAVLLRTA